VRQTFPSAGLGKQSGRLIFDIGGNKYRLIASVDFKEQLLLIERIPTHEDYEREVLG
jgi:mRNA interferase HigB